MEIVWDKGSSGLVFYTDAAYWDAMKGGMLSNIPFLFPCLSDIDLLWGISLGLSHYIYFWGEGRGEKEL